MNTDNDRIIQHWIESSDKDYNTMMNLFNSKDYYWSLFIGHIVLEKLLKAYYVQQLERQALPIHDLSRLAEKSKLQTSQEQMDILDTVTTFNIKARYDDYKREFYLKCTPEFTKEWIDKIEGMRTWIKGQLKRQ